MDADRVPTLPVLTRLAQGSGRLAAESVPGKVKAKNIPERGERRGLGCVDSMQLHPCRALAITEHSVGAPC